MRHQNILCLLFLVLASFSFESTAQNKHTFEIRGGDFVYDGKTIHIQSGEMHYSRIPHQYLAASHANAESAGIEYGSYLRLLEPARACAGRVGLKFGVYLSPWDRSHPAYGTPEYNEVFAHTLTEVLSNYGEVFEQWFDGANGEGPNGKRQVYDWELFHETVYRHQPDAVIFSDVGPGCRWIGNEAGYAGETNWS